MNGNVQLRKCSICGKNILPENPDMYAWKKYYNNTTHWFCGWNCMRKWEKNHPRRKKTQANDFLPEGDQ